MTNSLFSPWDTQFYPDMAKKGSYLLQVLIPCSLPSRMSWCLICCNMLVALLSAHWQDDVQGNARRMNMQI